MRKSISLIVWKELLNKIYIFDDLKPPLKKNNKQLKLRWTAVCYFFLKISVYHSVLKVPISTHFSDWNRNRLALKVSCYIICWIWYLILTWRFLKIVCIESVRFLRSKVGKFRSNLPDPEKREYNQRANILYEMRYTHRTHISQLLKAFQ